MPQVCWQVSPDGSYWIDVNVGAHDCAVMVDLGLVDSKNELGFVLEPASYDQLKNVGRLDHFRSRLSRDASGNHSTVKVP